MMKHLLNAPKVGVLLAILAMGSLAACEQTVEPEAFGTQRPEQFHEVVAGLDAGFYRVWNVARAQAGAPLPLTSDHPEWTWDRLKGFDNIVAALHEAAGTFHTPIALAPKQASRVRGASFGCASCHRADLAASTGLFCRLARG